jgi:hypothetical protein
MRNKESQTQDLALPRSCSAKPDEANDFADLAADLDGIVETKGVICVTSPQDIRNSVRDLALDDDQGLAPRCNGTTILAKFIWQGIEDVIYIVSEGFIIAHELVITNSSFVNITHCPNKYSCVLNGG